MTCWPGHQGKPVGGPRAFATRATALTMEEQGGRPKGANPPVGSLWSAAAVSFSVGKDLARDLPTNW
jgi:hypothetical protein